MEVDPPPSSVANSTPTSNASQTALNPLKRSNSAPMINVLGTGEPACEPKPSTSCSTPPPVSSSSNLNYRSYERIRRFSTSSMALCAPTTPVKVPSRLYQIKREETMPADREVAHEREFQSTMQMSQSWEELSLQDDQDRMVTEPAKPEVPPVSKRPKSLGEPLHIFTSSYPYASSPSPTRDRVGKQCFSPSLQQHVRNNTLTPSPSPSPTRKTFGARRSLSPTVHALRPSPLGGALKRKMEADCGDRPEMYFSPPKRFQPSHSPGGTTPERLTLPCHPLIHSISSSSLSDNSSPEQRVPNLPSSSVPSGFTNHQPAPATGSFTNHQPVPATGPFSFRPVQSGTGGSHTAMQVSAPGTGSSTGPGDSHTAMQVSAPGTSSSTGGRHTAMQQGEDKAASMEEPR